VTTERGGQGGGTIDLDRGGVAAIAVVAVLAIVAAMWAAIGDVDISAGGWVALVLGVLVTLALGSG